MDYCKIMLWGDADPDAWILCPVSPFPETEPVMLCVPGGGYGSVCTDTEGYPIAERFTKLGFRSFILHYHVAPNRYPLPQQDILRAIRMIRHRAKEWNIFPDNIAVCGFSAGGHLCASAGILYDRIPRKTAGDDSAESGKPDAVLLGYPVITAGVKSHAGSFRNLLGENFESMKEDFSLEKQVTSGSSPMFLWHTLTDQLVPYENSILLMEALHRANVPVDLHLFPAGPHGMALGYGREDIARWPEMAASFLRGTLGFRLPCPRKRTVVLTFDDCCRCQKDLAVPILQKYGFNATFFFCRFNDEWRASHEATLMTREDAGELCRLGFEVANHTWNHPSLNKLTEEEIGQEFDRMEQWLREAGCPPSVSFAYPGGPFAPNAVEVLKRRGILGARTTERASWTPETDPMRIPSFALCGDDELQFYHALQQAENGGTAVLLYHGIPETVHPHCSTSTAFFERNMKFLHDNGYEVISMREQLERFQNGRF